MRLARGRQHGLLTIFEGREQFNHAHVESRVLGLSGHKLRDRKTKHPVKDMYANILLGPVAHGAERDDLDTFHLS
jgi:hypothetical protein